MASDFEKDVKSDHEFWQDDEKYQRPGWLAAGDGSGDGPGDGPGDGDGDGGVDAGDGPDAPDGPDGPGGSDGPGGDGGGGAEQPLVTAPIVVETPAVVAPPTVVAPPPVVDTPTADHTTPVIESPPVLDTHSTETTTHKPTAVTLETPTAVDNSHSTATASEPTSNAPETAVYKAGDSSSDANSQGSHQAGRASAAESQVGDQQNQTETVYQADHEQDHSQTSEADQNGDLDHTDKADAHIDGGVDSTDQSSAREGSSHQAILTMQVDQAEDTNQRQLASENEQLNLDSADLHSAIESLTYAEISPAIAISTAALVTQLFKGDADHGKDAQARVAIQVQGADGRSIQSTKASTGEIQNQIHGGVDAGSLAMAAFAELPIVAIWLGEHEDLTCAIVAADSIRIFASATEIIKKKSMSQQTSEKLNQFSQNLGKLAGAALTAARKGIVGFY